MNMVLSDNKVIKNYDTLETGKKLYFRYKNTKHLSTPLLPTV